MRALGISGSLRRGSFNTALLRHAGDVFEAEGADSWSCEDRFDAEGRLNDESLEEQLREVVNELLAEADHMDSKGLAA